MAGLKNKAISVLHLFLVICFMTVAVHAGTGKRSLFPGASGIFANDFLPRASSAVAAEPGRPIHGKPRLRSEKVALEVLVGLAGSGFIGGWSMFLLDRIFPDSGENYFATAPMAVGYSGGSLFGSALGVYLVGNSGRAKGKFAAALLGSFLGEIAALGFTLLSGCNAGVYILSTAILPVAGATILFNSSLRVISFPAGNGLLNLEGDKLKLGIPAMQIRALPFHAKNMKPELRFDVRLLSITL